ncbi:hypothetical protein GPICK_04435 [Geobacter pickeringii]|uniref:Response regulatory domain-containing protein n=2 Tax=Geobacter pickeringii TaxID=345632 RepID=A0A0B5BEB1_9BACT|nr:hypothetical protein GPICK_04435 [Geobacter pickeringii]
MSVAGNGESAAGHILLVECDRERRKSLGFVLRLAGFRVTPVRTPFEALDWAVKRQGTPERFTALVVGSLTSPGDATWLAAELAGAGVALPVVLVAEGADVAPWGEGVVACRPEEVAVRLESAFGG